MGMLMLIQDEDTGDYDIVDAETSEVVEGGISDYLAAKGLLGQMSVSQAARH